MLMYLKKNNQKCNMEIEDFIKRNRDLAIYIEGDCVMEMRRRNSSRVAKLFRNTPVSLLVVVHACG